MLPSRVDVGEYVIVSPMFIDIFLSLFLAFLTFLNTSLYTKTNTCLWHLRTNGFYYHRNVRCHTGNNVDDTGVL